MVGPGKLVPSCPHPHTLAFLHIHIKHALDVVFGRWRDDCRLETVLFGGFAELAELVVGFAGWVVAERGTTVT